MISKVIKAITEVGKKGKKKGNNQHQDAPKPKTINFFAFFLLKEILKIETSYFFHTVNAVTVCRYLTLPRPIAFLEPRGVVQYDPKIDKKNYPLGYKSFVTHLWDKKEDLKISTSMLDRMAQGVSFLATYDSWEEYLKSLQFDESFKWASLLKATYYSDLTRQDQQKLDNAIHGSLYRLRNEALFKGKFQATPYSDIVTIRNNYCIRIALEEELKLVSKIGSSIKSIDENLLSRPTNPKTYIVVNEFSSIVASIKFRRVESDGDKKLIIESILENLSSISQNPSKLYSIAEIRFDSEYYLSKILRFPHHYDNYGFWRLVFSGGTYDKILKDAFYMVRSLESDLRQAIYSTGYVESGSLLPFTELLTHNIRPVTSRAEKIATSESKKKKS